MKGSPERTVCTFQHLRSVLSTRLFFGASQFWASYLVVECEFVAVENELYAGLGELLAKALGTLARPFCLLLYLSLYRLKLFLLCRCLLFILFVLKKSSTTSDAWGHNSKNGQTPSEGDPEVLGREDGGEEAKSCMQSFAREMCSPFHRPMMRRSLRPRSAPPLPLLDSPLPTRPSFPPPFFFLLRKKIFHFASTHEGMANLENEH